MIGLLGATAWRWGPWRTAWSLRDRERAAGAGEEDGPLAATSNKQALPPAAKDELPVAQGGRRVLSLHFARLASLLTLAPSRGRAPVSERTCESQRPSRQPCSRTPSSRASCPSCAPQSRLRTEQLPAFARGGVGRSCVLQRQFACLFWLPGSAARRARRRNHRSSRAR